MIVTGVCFDCVMLAGNMLLSTVHCKYDVGHCGAQGGEQAMHFNAQSAKVKM